MNKNIETWTEYRDMGGKQPTTVLIIKKKKGKLTREEVKEACMKSEWAYWHEIIDARGIADGSEDYLIYGDTNKIPDYAYCVCEDDISFN